MLTAHASGGSGTRLLPPPYFWITLASLWASVLVATSATAQTSDVIATDTLNADSLRRADSLDAVRRAAIRPPDTVRARPIGRIFARSALTVRPDSLLGWTKALVVSLNAAQAAYDNWVPGGQNTLAATLRLDGQFERAGRVWDALYTARLGYGVVRLDTLALRKAEDEIRLEGTWRYLPPSGFGDLQPTLAARFRSQFAPGFAYTSNPFKDGRTLPVKVSDFFAPAELSQSAGLTYDGGWIKQRAGFGLRQTIVTLPSYRILYGLDDDQLVRFDAGFEARTDVERTLMENVVLRSSLSLFAPVVPARRPDATWENRLAMRVNRWLQANVEAVAVYDITRSKRVQLREAFTLGLTMHVW